MSRIGAATIMAAVLALSACGAATDDNDDAADEPGDAASEIEAGEVPELDLESASLSDEGRGLADGPLEAALRYGVAAAVDPETGEVAGEVRADVPLPEDGDVFFRAFAGLPDLDTDLEIDDVTIDGDGVDFTLDGSLLTIDRPDAQGGDRVEVALSFSYVVPETDLSSDPLGGLGDGLDPSDIGLLGRHPGGVSLGHWFPIWLPDGTDAEPVPDGFGDIGNFPAAVITASVQVPEGWSLVSGGVNVDQRDEDGGVTFVEEGVGLRDLGVYIGDDVEQTKLTADNGTVVRATGAGDAVEHLDAVGGEAATGVATFADMFGAYAWSELDVVAVPLGSGVGGMEWPGMIWIESGIFAGGIPGLGDLGDLGLDEESLGDLGLDPELLEDLGLGDLGGLGGIESLREFVVAHEVAHQWWHAMIGNDSIESPIVDEPLAQFSACTYFEINHPDTAADACATNIDLQYQTMRMLGEEDAPADQPTDAFSSSLQYGGVVYGKAPGFYRALGDLVGDQVVLDALAGFVAANPFALASPDDLRAALRDAAPGQADAVDQLWVHWFEEAHGDEDIGAGDVFGGDLGGLEDLDPELFEDLLGR